MAVRSEFLSSEKPEVGEATRSQPVVYEISTRPWLYSLAQSGVAPKCGDYVCLKDVPDSVWQKFKDEKADVVWLMGLWELGQIALKEDKERYQDWRGDLPDITPDDVIGSPYSIIDYTVNPDIGNDDDLAQVRSKLNSMGIKLMVDFVPNHAAKDSKWLAGHTDIFLARPQNDNSPSQWWEQYGDKMLAHGRSPWPSDLWADTFQLNYWSPDTVTFMTQLLETLASKSDLIRCDMAMLALNDVWQRAWGNVMNEAGFQRPSEEFWHHAISNAKSKYPDVEFMAEAYNYGISKTPEKELLVQLGFDYVYDKVVLDNLESGHLDNTRNYIASMSQDKFMHTMHFVENHDEPRSAAALGGPEQAFAGAVVAQTLPGARLFFMGEYDGFKSKLVVQLRRASKEPLNPDLHAKYDKLLDILSDDVFHKGTWTYLPLPSDSWRLIAYKWTLGSSKRLVVVNFSDQQGWGNVQLSDAEGAGNIDITELLTGVKYQRSAPDLRSSGLTCGVDPWSAQIFEY